MLALSLHLAAALAFAPPADAAPAPGGDDSATQQEPQPAQEFGELRAEPEPEDPGGGASGGFGTLAPLPNYDEAGDEPGDGAGQDEPAVQLRPNKPKKEGFEEPEDFGPFFETEPVSEVEFPGDANRVDARKPFASVGGFCFVEASACSASLLIDADVGFGVNVISSSRGLNVPYTQMRFRGGLTLRPIKLARKHWHSWGVGFVGSYSLASASITATTQDPSDPFAGIIETDPIRTWRLGLINQIWLSQKRTALHLDFTVGGANSSVLNATGRYWGTHFEAALGFSGWGGLYAAGDFLDQDTRVFMGIRGHGIATGPLIALVLLGLVAGGASL
ncbi:MAG: hypothetical protein KC457_04315 [Myxococcales bacterium]|nr:hypothetical protein [Myxococcales bacterium]